jgi:hypothetical protein
VGTLRLALCTPVWACVAGCDPSTIQAVGAPGGVYRADQGCTLAPGAPVCPGPAAPQPELRFESTADPGVALAGEPGTLSNLRVTCVRSYCGTGSLTAHGELQWNNADPSAPLRMGSFTHAFAPAMDLMGRTIRFAVYVDAVTVPMHAQVGVIFDYWRWVGWAPLSAGWNRIEGVVSPSNPLTEIDPSVTSIPVSAIRIDVYVPVADASGPQGSWAGEIFLDDVSW